MSRRIIRLLHQTRRIEWDECSTEEAAGYREELLICVLAPKFNSVGKVWPRRGVAQIARMHPNFLRDEKAYAQNAKRSQARFWYSRDQQQRTGGGRAEAARIEQGADSGVSREHSKAYVVAGEDVG